MQVHRRSILSAGIGATALSLAGHIAGAPPAHAGPQPSTGISWPQGQVFPTFAKAKKVVIADATRLDGFDRLLLTSLQGVINARVPEIYLIVDPVDRTWVANLPVTTSSVADPMSLVSRYRDRVNGAIVYDLAAPDTINLATTMAGLKGCVVASAAQAEAHQLPIVTDLRGQFADDPAAIHEWQMANLWPQCTHRVLVGLPPATTVEVADVTWTEVAREGNEVRDSSNRKVYTFDLSAHLSGSELFVKFSDSFPTDGWGASVHSVTALANGATIASFTPGSDEEASHLFDGAHSQLGGSSNRFADGNNYFIYRFAIPAGTTSFVLEVDLENEYVVSTTATAPTRLEPFAQFRDFAVATKALVSWLPPSGDSGSQFADLLNRVEPGSAYAGWFSNDVSGEWSGVQLCSEHGVVVVAADFYANASVLSGIQVSTKASPSRRTTPSVRNTTYLTLTIGEGDNVQYCQRRMRDLWDDPGRGRAPMNWTVSPLLAEIGPALLRHYQQTATTSDLLVCGPSGAGYTYGDSWPQDALDTYTTMSGRSMAATGLDIVYAYSTPNSSGFPKLPDWVVQSYARNTNLRGIIQTDEHGRYSEPGASVPLIGTLWPQGSPADYKQGLLDHISAMGGTSDQPLFIAGLVNAWQWTPYDIWTLVRSLPSSIEVVLADRFFDLFAQTRQRATTPAAQKVTVTSSAKPHGSSSAAPTPGPKR
ncbi:GxGYxYP domain-containing protein [Aestuariimicrobium kwangyangense]|uniref:GxGYxYP domain-containing protein n=1 Tax=Aestuariimicrobium kwangyangense TaxID=396389 RepID=UPI0009FFF2B5|nr:GxGYxYP domain-containing protein [Aestuariimicrobium kwangyangense]